MPYCNTALQAFTAPFVSSMQLYRLSVKSVYKALQGLFWIFVLFFACYPAVLPAMLYSLQGAGGHTDKHNVSTDTRYHRHAGHCTGQHSRHIIIRYMRVRPCYGSMPARRRSRCFPRPAVCNLAPGQPDTLHPVGQSSSRGAAGGAEPLTAFAASLFGLSPDS